MKNSTKIAIIGLVLASCQNVKNFPDVPFVRLESYEIVAANVDPDVPGEHIVIDFYFTDGDGNIGLDDNQLNPPHCETCDHYYNLFVNVNSKVDGASLRIGIVEQQIKGIDRNNKRPKPA